MAKVLTGLQRWIDEGPSAVGLTRGARLGLLAHPASVDDRGRHVLDRLLASGDYRVERLFAPEHGLWGHEQDMEPVVGAVDAWSGLPVISLYGTDRDSLRPDPSHLADLDAVIVDLQDVGSRYYTFIYTMSYVMEVAGKSGVPVIVLDRPNPIGGARVEGPLLDPSFASFVGRYPLPVRHGMTVAELAGMFRERFAVGCELRVVPMRGWRRRMLFPQTGLPWIPPSPNMPTPATALVYPGACLIEGTNLSEGRGTTTPFELVGAPWIDGRELASRLEREQLPGVAFRPTSFRPMFHKHAGRTCGGLQIVVTNTRSLAPFATYLALIREARALDPERFEWRTETYEFEDARPAIDYLLGFEGIREMLETEATLSAMEALWSDGTRRFARSRRPFLLYD